jgi:hypothetical protein
MQPYFFPYLGYWQLLSLADRFVLYDDVNYIKGGWVNRNRIMINGQASYITIPLHGASSNKLICDLAINNSSKWREKMLKSIDNSYRKSGFYQEVYPIIDNVIRYECENLADYLRHQIELIAGFLGIGTKLISTSRSYDNNTLSGQERVIDICKKESANVYFNLAGGLSLYDSRAFEESGLSLRFLTMKPVNYPQKSADFIANLSIIDALMAIGKEGVVDRLSQFNVIEAEG